MGMAGDKKIDGAIVHFSNRDRCRSVRKNDIQLGRTLLRALDRSQGLGFFVVELRTADSN